MCRPPACMAGRALLGSPCPARSQRRQHRRRTVACVDLKLGILLRMAGWGRMHFGLLLAPMHAHCHASERDRVRPARHAAGVQACGCRGSRRASSAGGRCTMTPPRRPTAAGCCAASAGTPLPPPVRAVNMMLVKLAPELLVARRSRKPSRRGGCAATSAGAHTMTRSTVRVRCAMAAYTKGILSPRGKSVGVLLHGAARHWRAGWHWTLGLQGSPATHQPP